MTEDTRNDSTDRRQELGASQIEPILAVVGIVLEASLTAEDEATVNAEADRLGEAMETLTDAGLMLLASTAAILLGTARDEADNRMRARR